MVTSDPKDERPGDVAADPGPSGGRSTGRTGAPALRVGVLGLNAWAVSVALPARGTPLILADVVLILLPLLALALGLRMMGRRSEGAMGLLAVGVPVLLVAAVGGRSDAALSDRFGTLTMILAAFSSLAYVVAVADALGRPALLRETKETKLALAARVRPSSKGLRALVLGTTSTIALLLTIVLPALGTHASASAAWGEAADEGRVLTAIVGAAIACITTAWIVGPTLRAERAAPTRRGEGTLTVTLSLVVAATGAIAWAILRTVTP